jgi:hypothetical protein
LNDWGSPVWSGDLLGRPPERVGVASEVRFLQHRAGDATRFVEYGGFIRERGLAITARYLLVDQDVVSIGTGSGAHQR